MSLLEDIEFVYDLYNKKQGAAANTAACQMNFEYEACDIDQGLKDFLENNPNSFRAKKFVAEFRTNKFTSLSRKETDRFEEQGSCYNPSGAGDDEHSHDSKDTSTSPMSWASRTTTPSPQSELAVRRGSPVLSIGTS